MNTSQRSRLKQEIYKAHTNNWINSLTCTFAATVLSSTYPNMKLFVVFSVLATVALARPDGDHYDSKYDNFDVQTLIENPRLMKAYTMCLLSKGSCTAEGASFKKILPEAVATTCAKCTPKQRQLVRIVIRAVQKQLPNEWEQLVKLHDPEGKYKESFGKFLASSD